MGRGASAAPALPRLTPDAMTSEAALTNSQRDGVWVIYDCTVRLADTKQEDFWVIEMLSPLGVIDARVLVKSITVEEIFVDVPR